MIDGLGQYYFTSFAYMNTNFVISLFQDLSREEKRSGSVLKFGCFFILISSSIILFAMH